MILGKMLKADVHSSSIYSELGLKVNAANSIHVLQVLSMLGEPDKCQRRGGLEGPRCVVICSILKHFILSKAP